MKIQLHNDQGVIKRCRLGYCWSMLLGSWLVPIWRGNAKLAILYILLFFPSLFTIYLWGPCFANSVYIRSLLERGFKPSNEKSRQALRKKKWIV